MKIVETQNSLQLEYAYMDIRMIVIFGTNMLISQSLLAVSVVVEEV